MKINYPIRQLSRDEELLYQMILIREMKKQAWCVLVVSKLLHKDFLITLN